jgi:hypothetical protein
MDDPRLNSIHLEPGRRDDYRRARDLLLRARGEQTICAERVDREADTGTIIRNLQHHLNEAPEDVESCLVDNEFIYPLKTGINTVGRSRENDVVVEDGFISRRHCAVLVHRHSACELHDTASKNGTYLNGRRISGPTPLRSGDEIRICERQFVFLTRRRDAAPSSSSTSLTLIE